MSEAKLALEASNGSWVQASPRLAYVALMMISIPSMLSELLGVIFAGGLKMRMMTITSGMTYLQNLRFHN